MANRLDLSPLDDFFSNGEDFELTETQYEEKIKKPLPKTPSAIKGKNAPLARKAKENGFIIDSIRETPIIVRTVVFKKMEEGDK